MKRIRFFWLMLMLLVSTMSFMPVMADEITVNDGTTTNDYVPVWGGSVDDLMCSQFIIPSSSLEDISRRTITKLTFYCSQTSIDWGAAKFEIYMEEVGTTTTLSTSLTWNSSAKVCEARSLSVSSGKMEIVLDTPYDYTGENLKIGIMQTTGGSYGLSSWYGVNKGVAVYGYKYGYSWKSSTGSFLPKTTFTLEKIRKPAGLVASTIQTTSAVLSWDEVSDVDGYELSYNTSKDPDTGTKVEVTNTTYNLTDLLPETTYYAYVRAKKDGEYSAWSKVYVFIPTYAKTSTLSENATSTSTAIPIKGSNVGSYYPFSQFILPSSTIKDLSGKYINRLVFYADETDVNWGAAQFQVYLQNTTASSNSFTSWNSMTQVYSGTLNVEGGKMIVNLKTPFNYTGSNLRIGFRVTTKGSSNTATWNHGSTSEGTMNSIYNATATSTTTTTGTAANSTLPKVTIFYYGIPQNLQSANITLASADLTWTAADDETEWQVSYSTASGDPDNGTKVLVTDNASCTLTGLTAETTYYTYVRAKANGGYGPWSTVCSFTTLSPPAPTALAASDIYPTSATLTWDAAGSETEWQLSYSTTPDDPDNGTLVDNLTSTSYTFNNLIPETTYYVYVRAVEGNGEYGNWSKVYAFEPTAIVTVEINSSATDRTNKLPIYGLYANKYTRTQFIVPSTYSITTSTGTSTMSTLAGTMIKKLTFYSTTTDADPWRNATFDMKLAEVTQTYFTSSSPISATSTTVYSGSLSVEEDGKMVVTFSEPFAYNGGNLLVEFQQRTTTSKNSDVYWYYSSSSYCGFYYNGSSNDRGSMMPKMSIGYVTVPKNLAVNYYTKESATLTWDAAGSETEWQLSYSTTAGDPDNGTMVDNLTSTSYTLDNLTPETTYYAYVRAKTGDDYGNWSTVCEFTPSVKQKLTLGDESQQSTDVPFFANFARAYNRSQFIIPKSSLEDMAGSKISSLTFYGETSGTGSLSWGNAKFAISMGETTTTSPSQYFESTDDYNTVYTGSVSLDDYKMVVTFDTPFNYSGEKNLIIQFKQTEKGTDNSCSWYGVSTTDKVSVYGRNSSYLPSSGTQVSFLPKMTFVYEPLTIAKDGDFTYEIDENSHKAVLTAYTGSDTQIILPTSITYNEEEYPVEIDNSILTRAGVIFSYSVEDSNATIVGYYGTSADLTIPAVATLNGNDYQVTAIANGVFAGKQEALYVTFERTTPPTWADGTVGAEFCTNNVTMLIVPSVEAYSSYTAWTDNMTTEQLASTDFTWDYAGSGEAYLRSYNGSAVKVSIPGQVYTNGVLCTVTTIGSSYNTVNAFGSTLQEVVIPSTVTSIRSNAFANCTNLTTVTCMQDLMTFMDDCQFVTNSACTVRVPAEKYFTYLSRWRSEGYTATLAPFDYDDYIVVDGVLYKVIDDDENPALSMVNYDKQMAVVNIPATIERADKTYTVTSIEGIYSISEGKVASPFRGNSSQPNTVLEEVTIPSTVTSFNLERAFANCTALKTATIGCETIGTEAFMNCPNLEELIFTKASDIDISVISATGTDSITIKYPGVKTFNVNLGGLKNATIICENATSLTSVGANYALKNVSLVLPNCSTIGDNIFDKMIQLAAGEGSSYPHFSSISIGAESGIAHVGKRAFAECKTEWLHFDDATLLALQSVETVGDSAFYNSTMRFPETVTFANLETIGKRAFFNIQGTKEINLPAAKTIGDGAFEYVLAWDFLDELTSITLPEATTLGDYVFYGRQHITELDMPKVTSVGFAIMPESLVSLKMDALEYFPTDPDESFFHDALTADIYYPMFSGLISPTLKSVSFASLQDVPSNLFRYQFALEEVNMPEVKTVEEYAFAESGVTHLTLPEATTIGDYAFLRTEHLSELIVSKVPVIGNWFGSFYRDKIEYTPTFDGLVISARSATEIKDGAFEKVKTLNGLNAPNVTKVGNRAFYGATSVEEFNMPGIIEIGDSAFMRASITNLAVPHTVTKIGKSAFNGASIQVVRWYSNVNIPDSCFANNKGLEYAVVGDELVLDGATPTSCGPVEIGDGSFANCPNLKSINIGNSVKTIGHDFVKYGRSLSQVVIPSYVTTIKDGFLQGCDALRSVYLFNEPAELEGKTSDVAEIPEMLYRSFDPEPTDTFTLLMGYSLYSPPAYKKEFIHSFMPSSNYMVPGYKTSAPNSDCLALDPYFWAVYMNFNPCWYTEDGYYQNVSADEAQRDRISFYNTMKYYLGWGHDEEYYDFDGKGSGYAQHVNNCTFYVNSNEMYNKYINAKNASGEKIWERVDSLSAYNLAGTDGWAKYTGYELTDELKEAFFPTASGHALSYSSQTYPGLTEAECHSLGLPRYIMTGFYDDPSVQEWLKNSHGFAKGAVIETTVSGNGERSDLGDNYFNTIYFRSKNFPKAKGTPGQADFEWGGYRNKYQVVHRVDTLQPGTWQPIILTDEWQGPIAVLKSCKKNVSGSQTVYSINFELVPKETWWNNPTYVGKPCLIKTLVPWEYKYTGTADNPYWTADSRIVVPVQNADEGTTLSMIGCKLDHYLDKDEFYCSSKVKTVNGVPYEAMSFKKSKGYGTIMVKQFGCYFRLEYKGEPIHDPVISNASLAREGDIFDFEEEYTTAINETVVKTSKNSDGNIYNLNGQRVRSDWNSLPAGIYIVNGKKIVKK